MASPAASVPFAPLRRDGPGAGVLTVVLVAGFLLAAGCHSGGTPAAKRPFAAYRQCLEQHGVEPRRRRDTSTTLAGGETTTSTTRPDPAAFAAARQACRKLRPAGGLRAGGIGTGPRAAFRKCMTDHGVTLPPEDAGPGAGAATSTTAAGGKHTTTTATTAPAAPRGGMLRGLNRNDPTVAAALSACRSLLETSSSTTTTRK